MMYHEANLSSPENIPTKVYFFRGGIEPVSQLVPGKLSNSILVGNICHLGISAYGLILVYQCFYL